MSEDKREGLRERIKTVLNHYWIAKGMKSGPILEQPELQGTSLVGELLTLFPPEPNREALDQLMEEDFAIYWRDLPSSQKRIVLNRLMAWAAGEGEKSWCEHIYLEEGEWWQRKPPTYEADWIMAHWAKFCPVCGAQRPEERP